MTTKTITSTEVQNNFGQVLADITHDHIRYIVKRNGMPQVVMLSVDDFAEILQNSSERGKALNIIKEVRPKLLTKPANLLELL